MLNSFFWNTFFVWVEFVVKTGWITVDSLCSGFKFFQHFRYLVRWACHWNMRVFNGRSTFYYLSNVLFTSALQACTSVVLFKMLNESRKINWKIELEIEVIWFLGFPKFFIVCLFLDLITIKIILIFNDFVFKQFYSFSGCFNLTITYVVKTLMASSFENSTITQHWL